MQMKKEAWEAAVKAAATVVHDLRGATHVYSSQEVAEAALRAALHAAVDALPVVSE
jgi:hypothetical protein